MSVMARINFDDDVESQPEFWRLLPLVGGDRDVALGKLVRFFRLAQAKWGRGQALTQTEIEDEGLGALIKSGWALPFKDGFTVLGAEKHFGWYKQRVESSVAGGRARSAAPRDERGRLQPESSRNPPEVQPDTSPLAPSLALAPSLSKIQIQESVSVCLKKWMEVLKHHKAERNPLAGEDIAIGRMIQARGVDAVLLALLGAKYEPANKDYKPSRYLSLARINKPDRFEYFVNLGAQAKNKLAAKDTPHPEPPPEEIFECDPARVREIIAAAFPAARKAEEIDRRVPDRIPLDEHSGSEQRVKLDFNTIYLQRGGRDE